MENNKAHKDKNVNGLRRFINWNKKISHRFLEKHPIERESIRDTYIQDVVSSISDNMIIYDIGGGKNCTYVRQIGDKNTQVYAVDISADELEQNALVQGKIVSDVCKKIPIPYGQVDMITSSSVLEHLTDPEEFFKNAYNSLKAGGYFIHLCPCRYALFATINRILPKKLSRKILFSIHPDKKKTCGFPTYYKKLYYSEIEKMLNRQNFELLRCTFSYQEVGYYTFFFPLFIVLYAWCLIRRKLNIKNSASYILFVARKK